MELMDTSADKFYRMIYAKGNRIPEEVLGKIAVSVSTCTRITTEDTLQPQT